MGLSIKPNRIIKRVATLIAVMALVAQPMYGAVSAQVANAADPQTISMTRFSTYNEELPSMGIAYATNFSGFTDAKSVDVYIERESGGTVVKSLKSDKVAGLVNGKTVLSGRVFTKEIGQTEDSSSSWQRVRYASGAAGNVQWTPATKPTVAYVKITNTDNSFTQSAPFAFSETYHGTTPYSAVTPTGPAVTNTYLAMFNNGFDTGLNVRSFAKSTTGNNQIKIEVFNAANTVVAQATAKPLLFDDLLSDGAQDLSRFFFYPGLQEDNGWWDLDNELVWTETTIPTHARFTVTDANGTFVGNVNTVGNNAGGASYATTFANSPKLTGVDSYLVKNTYKGVATDFTFKNLKNVEAIDVTLEREDGTTITKSAKQSRIDAVNALGGAQGTLTAPIIIQHGTFVEADSSSWHPAPAWTGSSAPKSVTVKITMSNGGRANDTHLVRADTTISANLATLAEVMPAVDVPELTSPSNGAFINTDNFYFDWEDVEDAVEYEFQSSQNPAVDANGVLTTGVWKSKESSDRNFITDSRLHSYGATGTWHWQVRAVGATGSKSEWSPAWSMTIDTAAPTISWQLQPLAYYGTGTDFHVRPITNEVGTTKSVYIDSVTPGNLVRTLASDHKNFDTTSVNNQALWSGLSEGTHKFIAVFTDRAGNTTVSQSNSFVVDRTAPVVKVNLNRASYIASGDAVRSVAKPEIEAADTNLDRIEVWKNGSKVTQWLADSSSRRAGISWLGEGTYTIRVFDKAGNQADDFVVIVDNTPPTAAIESQYDGDKIRGTVSLRITAEDDDMAAYSYRIRKVNADNSNTADPAIADKVIDTTSSVTDKQVFSWNTSQLGDGKYYIYVSARDQAGNRSEQRIYVTVDNDAPDAPAILTPIASHEYPSSDRKIAATWTIPEDNSGIEKYEIRYEYTRNGVRVTDTRTVASPTYTQSLTGNVLSDFVITVRAQDEAGNWSDWSEPRTYYYGVNAPTNSSESDDAPSSTTTNQGGDGGPTGSTQSSPFLATSTQRLLAVANTANLVDDVVPASESDTGSDAAVLGTGTQNNADKAAVAGVSTSKANGFNYWLILAALAAIAAFWWIIAAIRRKRAAQEA